ncbi:hypothetical protein GDO78_019700 [Eleutherodactylus coqui]|uniref:Uncharacterized protein n=1 Tax=Eleutherodactylus coqui TaxID=57060 RepID=A0A8J6C285_ELECQ|nr:hypothetical protein GDO78_019700 [Eleutherodactylus coqui]
MCENGRTHYYGLICRPGKYIVVDGNTKKKWRLYKKWDTKKWRVHGRCSCAVCTEKQKKKESGPFFLFLRTMINCPDEKLSDFCEFSPDEF